LAKGRFSDGLAQYGDFNFSAHNSILRRMEG
jgi:hypothetical protein